MKEFKNLIDIVKRLRSPEGCPWDREQTIESLKPYLLEETYETLEAMDIGGDALKGELGDLLLQIVLQSIIMEEKGHFDIEDVSRGISEKLIRRHPHVFGEVNVENTAEVLVNWEKIKKDEKEHQDRKSLLDGIPKTFPPMMRAFKLQKRAATVGFDWQEVDGALVKMEEEIEEMREAFANQDMENLKEEMGDVIFSMVNVARLAGIDVNEVLTSTNNKFERRFRYIEDNCDIEKSDIEKMESLWEKAKQKEKIKIN